MNSNLFFCLVGIIGGAIFSFIISFIFYLLSKSKKSIKCTIKTSSFISNKIIDVDCFDIQYDHTNIKKYYLSIVKIKNSGNCTIERNDFSNSHPLSISSLDFILGANLQKRTHIIEDNNVGWSFKSPPASSNLKSHQILIDFEYIPPKGIISFCILHTKKILIDGYLKNDIIKKTIFPKNK